MLHHSPTEIGTVVPRVMGQLLCALDRHEQCLCEGSSRGHGGDIRQAPAPNTRGPG